MSETSRDYHKLAHAQHLAEHRRLLEVRLPMQLLTPLINFPPAELTLTKSRLR